MLHCLCHAGSRSDSDEEVGGNSDDAEASSSSSEDDDDYSERDRCVGPPAGLRSTLRPYAISTPLSYGVVWRSIASCTLD